MNNEFAALHEQVCHCTACRLCETRTNVVFGDGNPEAKILFIGEGPGEREDATGTPFVGRAGQLLDKMLAAVDLDRTKVYIANMVKCRPPQNRDPRPDEVEACIGYLRRQVALIKPTLIVCLGRVAAMRLISADFKVTRQHGEIIEKGGLRFMGTFHPAALLRNPHQKPEAFEDFLKIRAEYDKLQ